MSYSSHRRLAPDPQQPLPHRASHARSCAMLIAQKWRITRSAVLAQVRTEAAVDLEGQSDVHALLAAVECLDRLRFRGPQPSTEQE